ncbi:hypothetical protein F5X99DRAFT_401178 [Biscogniauxia marginata]|nr:hypothetical protein F5X99DRAFT_401178 [Biscogniauxia marginata]
MGLGRARIRRAIQAVPFLFIAAWCLRTMDVEKLAANQQPFADSGIIEWEGGKISILDHFHHVEFLDQLWRGTTATFSPSTLGYDPVSSWQTFSFLIDIGPAYAIWLLESYRPGGVYTPANFPTIFTLAAQLLGIGSVAPIFYFLCLTFSPTASDLARSSVRDRTILQGTQSSGLLLPIVFLLHTCEIFAMFLAPEPTTRHFWTWAWQLTPLWIGIAYSLYPRSSKTALLTSTKFLLAALGSISAVVWVYTLLLSPYPMSTLFLPVREVQSEFVAHARKAFQADELGLFSSSFLWLVYSFLDLYTSGLLGNDWLYQVALIPITTAFAGPGVAFTVGWYLRERALLSVKKN